MTTNPLSRSQRSLLQQIRYSATDAKPAYIISLSNSRYGLITDDKNRGYRIRPRAIISQRILDDLTQRGLLELNTPASDLPAPFETTTGRRTEITLQGLSALNAPTA